MSTRRDSAAAPAERGHTFSELRSLVGATLRAGVSVLLRGHPGVGKSTLAALLAADMGLDLVDIRLAQREPAELGGVYFPDEERKTLRLLAPEWVQRVCAAPALVFLDEINAAVSSLHQAAAYQIVLERRVGPFRFHPGTVVLAAGNLEEDGALVARLSSALRNRFAHFVLRVDAPSWLDWGARHDIDEAILGYIGRYGEEALYSNDGAHAFPTPRSWAMASRVLRATPSHLRRAAVSACVGAPAASKLFDHLALGTRIDPARIVREGQRLDFRRGPDAEPSFIYAAVFAVAAWLQRDALVSDAELPNIVRFLRTPGLEPELAFLLLRQLAARTHLVERLERVPDFRRLADELVSLRLVAA